MRTSSRERRRRTEGPPRRGGVAQLVGDLGERVRSSSRRAPRCCSERRVTDGTAAMVPTTSWLSRRGVGGRQARRPTRRCRGRRSAVAPCASWRSSVSYEASCPATSMAKLGREPGRQHPPDVAGIADEQRAVGVRRGAGPDEQRLVPDRVARRRHEHDRAVAEEVDRAVHEAQVTTADLVERDAHVGVLRGVLGGLPLVGLDERDGVRERPVAPAVVEVQVAVDDVGDGLRVDAGARPTGPRRGRRPSAPA